MNEATELPYEEAANISTTFANIFKLAQEVQAAKILVEIW